MRQVLDRRWQMTGVGSGSSPTDANHCDGCDSRRLHGQERRKHRAPPASWSMDSDRHAGLVAEGSEGRSLASQFVTDRPGPERGQGLGDLLQLRRRTSG
jgi:hypothetical protein